MSNQPQILRTKLQVPKVFGNCLTRNRLTDRLTEGLPLPLTLLSAPAGYGKTTLLANWIHREAALTLKDHRIAWLSLDEYDNDPDRFVLYLVAALHQVEDSIGSTALKMISMVQEIQQEDLLVSILNDVQKQPFRILFVVDDFHLAQDKRVHRQVAFLLNHLPANVHVILSTREDPPEFMPRFRARGLVNEIRAADLRFSSEEINEFLQEKMGLNLPAEEMAVLENRTEGWIAALQLAASALQKVQDTSVFIQGFSGTHPLILDFLLEEIFNQQEETEQRFLLKTSILERLTPDLCDALTEEGDGRLILERLIRSNLLIEPLDNTFSWCRYHRIFSSFLRNRLEYTLPAEVQNLHQKAARWYDHNGFSNEAIFHALEGNDYQLADQLLEKMQVNPITQLGTTTVMGWLNKFPEAYIQENPRLLLWFTWSSLYTGNLSSLRDTLNSAEEILFNMDVPTETSGADLSSETARYRYMRGEAEALRSYLAYYEDDPTATIKHSQQALTWFGGAYPGMEGHVKGLLGNAYTLQLNYPLAVKAYLDASQTCFEAGEEAICWLLLGFSARLQYGMGNLEQAEETLLKILKQMPFSSPYEFIHGKTYIDLGEIARERNNFREAQSYLDAGISILENECCSSFLGDGYISRLSLFMSQKDWAKAKQVLRKAKQLTFSLQQSKLSLQIAAYETWLNLMQGDVAGIQDWIVRYSSTLMHTFGFAYEFPQYILVRARLAQFRNKLINEDDLFDCIVLLDRLLLAAEKTDRLRSVVTISILKALIYQDLQQPEKAISALRTALVISEQSGLVQLFLDEGIPMEQLLQQALERKICTGYTIRLLVSFREALPSTANTEHTYTHRVNEMLVEPLSPRELEILNRIAKRASNKEIAEHCSIEVSTVKSHVSNILGKLGSRSRRQAVQYARDIGLIHS